MIFPFPLGFICNCLIPPKYHIHYARVLGSIPGWGRSPGGGHGTPLQYSCLENPHGQRSLEGYSPGGAESDTTQHTGHHIHWVALPLRNIPLLTIVLPAQSKLLKILGFSETVPHLLLQHGVHILPLCSSPTASLSKRSKRLVKDSSGELACPSTQWTTSLLLSLCQLGLSRSTQPGPG